MRRFAILVALAACEAGDSGDGDGAGSASSVTTAPAESSDGSEAGAAGSSSTGEPASDCLTPNGDPCPSDAVCATTDQLGGASVCLESCSETGQCKTGLECRGMFGGGSVEPAAVDVCVASCRIDGTTLHTDCGGGMECLTGVYGACFWPGG